MRFERQPRQLLPAKEKFRDGLLLARLSLGLLMLLALSGTAKADDTNGVLPSVSVWTDQNAAVTGSLPGIFTVQRTGDTNQALVVNYQISGTATNGVDYEQLSGTVTIPAGQSSTQIEVTPIDNFLEGPDKNVIVTLVPQNQPFTIVALPDTQYYTHEINGGSREIFTAQTQWIVNHKNDSNIVFVLHEGDITDDNNAPEWSNAVASISLLDGVVPYALAVGNHDGISSSQSQTALFNQFFPLSRYQNLPTFGGVFESNRMDNCYHLFSAGGVDWLVLDLEFGPRDSVLAWANQIIANYPNRRVIVLTHAHVYSDNTLLGSSIYQIALPTSYGRMNNGTDVWQKLLRHYPNVCAVFCGHISGTGRLVGMGDYSNQVFQILADYQSDPLGGGGYLRIVQFFPDQDEMSVSTYSPYLDSWHTDPANQFIYTNLGVFTNVGPGYLVDTQSATASLTITNDYVDLVPPAVSAVTAEGIPPVISAVFDEPVETASAETVTNYSLDHGIQLTSATLAADGRTVELTTDSALAANTLYTLTVNYVKDCARATNEMSVPATNTFTYVPAYLSASFADSTLTGWTVVDEGTINAPSMWIEGSGRLMQLSNIYGPNANATDHRKGTYLYWNDPQALGWSNYAFSVTFNNSDDDGVGVMFCYQDSSNYYKVDLDAQRNFHKLFKMAGGIETTLAAEPGGYVTASNYVLRVEVTNSEIIVLLNGTVLFGGPVNDSSLSAGTVAPYSWASQGVFFSNLNVLPLQRWPRVTIQSPTNGVTVIGSAPVPVTMNIFCPDSQVQTVQLFWGNSLLATLTNAPYVFQWTNPPTGTVSLIARVIDDSGRTGISSPVSFTVVPSLPGPTLAQQPSSQTVQAGSGAAFWVRAYGSGPLFYQWQFNSMSISGATNTFLLLNNVQSTNAGSYAVTVSNLWGGTVSQPATLAVNAGAPPPGQTNGPAALYFTGLQLLAPGGALVSVTATNLSTVRIDWSSNCLDWVPLLTLTNFGAPLYFSDPDALNQPCRFYRAVAQP